LQTVKHNVDAFQLQAFIFRYILWYNNILHDRKFTKIRTWTTERANCHTKTLVNLTEGQSIQDIAPECHIEISSGITDQQQVSASIW